LEEKNTMLDNEIKHLTEKRAKQTIEDKERIEELKNLKEKINDIISRINKLNKQSDELQNQIITNIKERDQIQHELQEQNLELGKMKQEKQNYKDEIHRFVEKLYNKQANKSGDIFIIDRGSKERVKVEELVDMFEQQGIEIPIISRNKKPTWANVYDAIKDNLDNEKYQRAILNILKINGRPLNIVIEDLDKEIDEKNKVINKLNDKLNKLKVEFEDNYNDYNDNVVELNHLTTTIDIYTSDIDNVLQQFRLLEEEEERIEEHKEDIERHKEDLQKHDEKFEEEYNELLERLEEEKKEAGPSRDIHRGKHHSDDEEGDDDEDEEPQNVDLEFVSESDTDKSDTEGSGMVVGGKKLKDGLSDVQINQIMEHYPHYLGTIAIDEFKNKILPLIKQKSKGCFIINTKRRGEGIGHWIAIYFDGKKSIEYFDSYGEDPSKQMLQYIQMIADKLNSDTYLKLKVNKVKHQNNTSLHCGPHAIKFLIARMRGNSFKDATGYDDTKIIDKSNENEKKIEKFNDVYLSSFTGGGLLDIIKETWRRVYNFIKGVNEMPPKMKDFLLTKAGLSPIEEMWIYRAPITNTIQEVLNILSQGEVSRNLKRYSYDDLYHLSLVFYANGTWYLTERRPRVIITRIENDKDLPVLKGVDMSKIQRIKVNLHDKKLSIADMMKNAITKYSEQTLFSYDAIKNNCQDYIIQLLTANDLLTEEIKQFVKQPVDKLFENTGILSSLSSTITNWKHRLDGLLYGDGNKNKNKIQAILFDKRYFSKNKAKEWMKKHNIKPIKDVHETKYLWRYRLMEPDSNYKYITKSIFDDKIKLIIVV